MKKIVKNHTTFPAIFTRFPFLAYLPPHTFRRFMMFFDLCIVSIAFFGAYFFDIKVGCPGSFRAFLGFLPIVLAIWGVLIYRFNVYSSVRARNKLELIVLLLQVAFFAYILLSGYLYVIGEYKFFNWILLIFTIMIAAFIYIEKLFLMLLFSYLHKKGISFRNILVVGTGQRAQQFIDRVERLSEWGINIIGLIDEEKMVGSVIKNIKVIGSFNDLEEILDKNIVDEVVFILPRKWLSKLEDYIHICEKIGARVSIAADFFSPSIATLKTADLYGFPFLSMQTTPYNIWHLFIKRIMDFFISLVAIILSTPVLIIFAVAIKLSSPGHVIFKQKRVGLNGRIFTLYKFRTMITGAEEMLDKVKDLTESDGPVFHSRNDPRVTPIGLFLRMTSLDELPQLVNVFLGDMSIIGPRPPLPEEVKEYERWQRRRLSLRPGIVCTWQVTKRFQPDFGEWMQMDLDYIDNWSLGLDFKILLKVFPAILKGWRYWRSKK